MDGKAAFIYAVDQDWIGKSGVIPLKAKNFEISGSRALSDVFANGQKVPYKMIYTKEGGEWKFDLNQVFMNSEAPMKMAAKQEHRSGGTDHF